MVSKELNRPVDPNSDAYIAIRDKLLLKTGFKKECWMRCLGHQYIGASMSQLRQLGLFV